MRLLARWFIAAAVIFSVAYFSDGALLKVADPWTAVWAALALGVANVVVRPLVQLLTLPFTLLTLGLFLLVVNALMLYLVDWVVPGFETVGFWRTVLAALIISVATSILGPHKKRHRDD